MWPNNGWSPVAYQLVGTVDNATAYDMFVDGIPGGYEHIITGLVAVDEDNLATAYHLVANDGVSIRVLTTTGFTMAGLWASTTGSWLPVLRNELLGVRFVSATVGDTVRCDIRGWRRRVE